MIDGYMVLKMHPLGEIQCKCARCTWRGFTSAVKEIKACELTPGDVSPIGRCPNCFELAYPDRETDRTQAFGAETKEALKAMVDLQLNLRKGKTVKSDQIDAALERAAKLLKSIRGRNLSKPVAPASPDTTPSTST